MARAWGVCAGTQPELLLAFDEILGTLKGTDFGKPPGEFVLNVVVPSRLLDSPQFNSKRTALEAQHNVKLVLSPSEKARVPRTRCRSPPSHLHSHVIPPSEDAPIPPGR